MASHSVPPDIGTLRLLDHLRSGQGIQFLQIIFGQGEIEDVHLGDRQQSATSDRKLYLHLLCFWFL